MMKQTLYFLIFALLSKVDIHADGIENYFQPAENKSGEHGMPGIDFIYMINLDKRPEKYARTMAALMPYNIYPW